MQPIGHPAQEELVVHLANAILFAEETAELAATFLRAWWKGLGLRGRPSLPRAFLVELGAILRIHAAQRAHMTWAVDGYGPPDALFSDLVRRFQGNPTALLSREAEIQAQTLLGEVWYLWARTSCWRGLNELGAEIGLECSGSEVGLEVIAAFLWKHRHLGREGF